jgi:hypothetical protein
VVFWKKKKLNKNDIEKRLAVIFPTNVETTSDFTKFSLSYYNHLTTGMKDSEKAEAEDKPKILCNF